MKKGTIIVISSVIGAAIGACFVAKAASEVIAKNAKQISKFKGYYTMLNQWMAAKQKGKTVEQVLLDQDIHSIAIYGMGEMGNRLYEECVGSKINVLYAIDKEASQTYSELPVYSVEDDLEAVDAIIVTATFAFAEIKEELETVTNCPVISLDDIIYKL